MIDTASHLNVTQFNILCHGQVGSHCVNKTVGNTMEKNNRKKSKKQLTSMPRWGHEAKLA